MKRIISVSLGSSKRDHRVELEFFGEKVTVERVGTDGDLAKAVQMIKQLDGQVDAFGMGGIDLYLFAGAKRFTVRDAAKMARAARTSPIVDGSGLKNTLERRVVQFLNDQLNIDLKGKKVLMASSRPVRYGPGFQLGRGGSGFWRSDFCVGNTGSNPDFTGTGKAGPDIVAGHNSNALPVTLSDRFQAGALHS